MGVWKRRVAGLWVDQAGYVVGSTDALAAHEMHRWQVRAALLDPLAYTTLAGSGASATVPVGETWYVVSAWRADAAGIRHMHRVPDAGRENYYALREGETITLQADAGAMAHICKPAAVTAADARYGTDPKGLFFERLYRADTELTHEGISHANTGAGSVSSAFPTDFTYGVVLACSSHDVAWSILRHSNGSAGINLDNEVSDTNRIRFAQRVVVPFARATFPSLESRGVSQSEGSSSVRYVKLPADW